METSQTSPRVQTLHKVTSVTKRRKMPCPQCLDHSAMWCTCVLLANVASFMFWLLKSAVAV